MHQRHQAQIGQFLLATVGDRDLGRTLERHLAIVGGEGVGGQALDQSPAFDPADGRAPAVPGERVGDLGTQRVGRVHPQVAVVFLAACVLGVVERLHRRGVRAIGQTPEHSRHGQANVTRIVGGTERLPLGVLDRVEDLGQVTRSGQFGEVVEAQQFGRGR